MGPHNDDISWQLVMVTILKQKNLLKSCDVEHPSSIKKQ